MTRLRRRYCSAAALAAVFVLIACIPHVLLGAPWPWEVPTLGWDALVRNGGGFGPRICSDNGPCTN
ncbi:MAG: hypothetical protein QOG43_138 [Actinomycetota bacterium]|nr:hypothetical protein [Actinomycetota bacterium]